MKEAVKKSKALKEKAAKVHELASLLTKYKSIGVLDLTNLPAKQLKATRAKVAEKILFYFARKSILLRALEEAKREELKQLKPYIESTNCALLLSNCDSFEMFRLLKANKQATSIKPGQVVPFDIIVPAGPTPFAPGPITSEFAQLGLKTKVEAGKIVIREPAVIVKKDQPASPLAASMLSRLGIKPIEIAALPKYVLENGLLYAASILDVDVNKYAQDLKTAVLNGVKLASEIGLVSPENAQFLLMLAVWQSAALQNKLENIAQKVTEQKV
ncbi:MAG: 50S ribosomal protein L10 [Candidatus Nanoarchaeia archaeon]